MENEFSLNIDYIYSQRDKINMISYTQLLEEKKTSQFIVTMKINTFSKIVNK